MERDGELRLFVRDPVRLEYRGKPVKLRRKSLGVLAHLAVSGPTRREVLADLLWNCPDSTSNLRVELHSVRVALAALDLSHTGLSSDPLILPNGIETDWSGKTELLAGFTGLTPAFDDWLDMQRFSIEEHESNLSDSDLVNQPLGPGTVVILDVQPGTSMKALVSRLARRHGISVVRGFQPSGHTLHYLGDARKYSPDVVDQIVGDSAGIWVLKQLTTAAEPAMILSLHANMPPERIRYVRIPPFSWSTARNSVLSRLSFTRAAEVFLASSGHRGYVHEIVRRLEEGGTGSPLSVPQRVRAAYLLEAGRLSEAAQRALEACSTVEGALQEEHLSTLGVNEQLDELERRGWLAFDGVWRFADETARQVVLQSVQPGTAHRYRKLLAQAVVPGNQVLDEQESGSPVSTGELTPRESNLCSVVEQPEPGPRREIELLDGHTFGPGVSATYGQVTFVRQVVDDAISGIEWQLPRRGMYVKIQGKSHGRTTVRAPGTTADFPNAIGLAIKTVDRRGLSGSRTKSVRTVQLTPEVDVGFEIEEADALRIEYCAGHFIAELQISVFELTNSGVGSLGPSDRAEGYSSAPNG